MPISPFFGAGIGWIFGGPIGALLGAAGSHLFNVLEQKTAKKQLHERRSAKAERQSFAASLMVLTAAIMKADGRPSKEELAVVKNFLQDNFGQAQTQEILYVLRDLLKKDIPVQPVCQQIRSHMNYSQRLMLLHFLYSLAYADDALHASEQRLLQQIAMDTGIRLEDSRSISAMFAKRRTSTSDYQILEVEPTASDDAIRKAFRRLSVKHHPDKVASLGPEIQKAATEKFQSISAAYDRIRKKRGMR